MKEIYLKELNKKSKELGLPPILYRDLWVYALSYTYGYSNQELIDDYSYQIVKLALAKMDIKKANREATKDYTRKKFCKEVIQDAMNELGIKETKKVL